MKLYESSVRKPITTILIFVGLIVIGAFSFTRLSVDLFPDIETNQLTVITTYAGANASDIETNVTRPLEDALNSCENLKKITSKSKDNMSLVTLEFNYGSDINAATNDVRDKLDLVRSALPDEITNPIIFKFSMDMMPVCFYIASAEESSNALYKILDDKIANPLNRVKGVGAVSIMGASQRQVQVNIDPGKLDAYKLTVEQIARIISAENANVPAGSFDIGSETYSLRVEGELRESSELLNIVVGSHGGRTVFLRDVATVDDTVKDRVQETYTDGRRSAMIIIQKQSGANTVEIANTVAREIPALTKSLPEDVKVSLMWDTSEFIESSIHSLTETILLAMVFVIIVVLFFLGRWRATIIIILTIPISLIVSFIYLMATGGSLNIISLSSISIAVGLVVDDAIVVLENITTHIERGSSPREASIYGTNEVAVAVMASTLTIVAVFFPMTLITGLAGVMFQQLGWMVTIMILMSVVAALSFTPMMCSLMLKATPKQGKFFDKMYAPVDRFLDRLDIGYAKLVNLAVRNRWKTFFISMLIFVVSMFSSSFVKTDFMPVSDNGYIEFKTYLPTGTRMEVARATAQKISGIVRDRFPEVDMITFSVGQADEDNIFSAVMDENSSNLVSFSISCVDEKLRNKTIFDISNEIRAIIDDMPEIYKYKVTPGGEGGMFTGASTLDVEIYGYDLETTDRLAALIKDSLAGVRGLKDLVISRQDYRSEYQIVFDREKLALHGLTSAEVASYARSRINGLTLSKFREDGDEYDIVVRYDKKFREDLKYIEDITVYTPQGAAIKMKELGTLVEMQSLPQIDRENRQRVVKVQGSLYNEPLQVVVEAVNAKLDIIREDGRIPSEIGVQLGGTIEDQGDTFTDMILLMLLCVLLVYIVMAAQFESLTYPFIIMTSLLFGVSGVFVALAITGKPMSVMAMIGMVMLIGIVVKNGIVLIDYINLNRERGMSIDRAIVSGGKSRLRPVLMTTATAVLGMIPMAIPRGGGSAMWEPMAIAIIGGLSLSTLLTLVLVPSLYSIFGGVGVRRRRRKFEKQLRNKNK